MSQLRVNNVTNVSGSGPALLSGAGPVYLPGSVCQVVHTNTGTFTALNSGQFMPYNGLDTTVSPKFSGSKFLIRYQINVGNYSGSMRVILKINGSYYNTFSTDDYRASSNSFYGSGGLPISANIVGLTGEYLFTNSGTSPVVVSFELYRQDTGTALYVNRSYSYDDTARGRPTSYVTIEEVVQ